MKKKKGIKKNMRKSLINKSNLSIRNQIVHQEEKIDLHC